MYIRTKTKKDVTPSKACAFFIILALKQRPKFTVSAVLDGKYFSEFEEYYQDTFPYRDKFLDINSKISKAFSKTQGNSGMVIVEKQEKDDFAGQNID